MLAPVLSAATSDAEFSVIGMFLFLFLAFGIAAFIWLLLWMHSGVEDDASEDSKGSEPPESGPAHEPRSEPEPESEAESRSFADSAASQEDDLPDIDTVSEVQAAERFSAELAEGIVRQDSIYGIVYREAPDPIDDLKKIQGVAGVLEGKLNEVGVYRFKQIAVWTEAACQQFSTMLAFKDRIYRDDWITQAKEFHREKYEEEL